MSHPQQREFIESVRRAMPQYFTGVSVLEIGSLNINGTVRDFFNAREYIGVDLAAGPGVDVVCPGNELRYDDNSFDVVISAECFEHDAHWQLTFSNMFRMARGLVIFTCATTGRAEHGTARTSPADSPFTCESGYYRNLTPHDFYAAFNLSPMFARYDFSFNHASHDLYFWGEKCQV
jgi:hypothetical protein